MTKCKTCKKKIAEGLEYCEDCLDEARAKNNESYLDNLLNSVKKQVEETEAADNMEDKQEETDDLSFLLDQMTSDDPVAANIKDISDIIEGKKVDSQPISDDWKETKDTTDLWDDHSDALDTKSSLEGSDTDIQEGEDLSFVADDSKEKKKGKSIFRRLFANVKDEKVQLKAQEKEEKASAKEDLAEKKEEMKRERKEEKRKKEEERKEKKQEKRNEKKKIKEERKRAAIEILNEGEEDGRINRLGASVVFVFFGIILILILLGTELFSYSLKIDNASRYFQQGNYTEAYKEINGLDLDDSDHELYDKIITVMFVNKQFNSYNSYYEMGKYPEALDSLLKGLNRYDKYIDYAITIGVQSDLENVKDKIVQELENEFGLYEEEAYQIIKSETQREYSARIYDIILNNKNNKSF